MFSLLFDFLAFERKSNSHEVFYSNMTLSKQKSKLLKRIEWFEFSFCSLYHLSMRVISNISFTLFQITYFFKIIKFLITTKRTKNQKYYVHM